MAKKTHKFKTEVQQLLDLVIHSLYSKKEIFLRELISNASDAIDRRRFEALTDEALHADDESYRIVIQADAEKRTLTVSDNGIGMTEEEVDRNIGTIANSGTRHYLETLKAGKQEGADRELIGQFGVGFYASFMVADTVELITRKAGASADEAVRWRSDGSGSYSLEAAEREEPGTDVILHLREGLDDYLQEWQIRSIVKQYSDYIAFPIVMPVERKKDDQTEVVEETLNSIKAIWRKDKKEISDEEYKEFYTHISHDHHEPLTHLHFKAEGVTEFNALVYIPGQAPFDLYLPQSPRGVHLYVRNVFITDECKELVPEYLRFLRGVVDSSDLPLNVSREILQDDAVLHRIRKSLIGKVLNHLKDLNTKKPDDYRTFYKAFGRVLKEGLPTDAENADKIKDLLLFPSMQTDDDAWVSLKDYVADMPEDQKDIYYLTAEHLDTAKRSPLLEAFRKRNYNVLFWTDAIDEWMAPALTEYDGHKLTPVDRGELSFDDDDAKAREDAAGALEALIDYLKKRRESDVKEVRVSTRLTDSACCLVQDEQAMNPAMRRMMEAMQQGAVTESKPVLEINPDHPVIQRMNDQLKDGGADDKTSDYADLLYYQALTASGAMVDDPSRFAQLINELIMEANA